MFSLPQNAIFALIASDRPRMNIGKPKADGDRVAVGVEQTDGEILGFVDDRVIRRAHQVGLHLAGDRHHRAANHLGGESIDFILAALGIHNFRFHISKLIRTLILERFLNDFEPFRTTSNGAQSLARYSELHHQMPVRIDRHRIAGLDHRRRRNLFDDRRAVDDVALQAAWRGRTPAPPALRRLRRSPCARRAAPSAGGVCVALGNLRKLRLAQPPDRRHAQAHDIGGLLRRAVAVAQVVGLVEQPLDLGARAFHRRRWPACAPPPHVPGRRSAYRRRARKRSGPAAMPESSSAWRPSASSFLNCVLQLEHLQIVHALEQASARSRGADRP